MKLFILIISALVFWPGILPAQQKWDLKKCIEYALANNINIKQTELQATLSQLQLKQSRQGQYPGLNFSTGSSFSSGRNQDPTSFSLITQSYLSSNLQLQSSVEIFNWFSKRNLIAANQWEFEASRAGTDKLKNDISLTIANVYLQILLSKEQEKIALVQLQQSQAQLLNTRKLVNAGAQPELNAAELEAQVARDSATYIGAKGNTEINLLSMKAFMAMDAAVPFEVDTPPVELKPEMVYASAIANLPQQRVNDFKIKSAEKSAEASRGAMYPTISAFGSLGSGFNSRAREITGSSPVIAPLGKVTVSGVNYDVFPLQPFTNYSYGKQTFFSQANQNFRQSIGLSMSVPIFSGGSLRSNYERSKINLQNLRLQQQADNMKLKQDIYQAYNNAVVSLEKFNAGKKSVAASERSFGFAQKRYAIGMLNTMDLLINQNNLFRAKLELALSQFDYVFKMKVLEFYKGLGLKL
jgi:outer membrane protein